MVLEQLDTHIQIKERKEKKPQSIPHSLYKIISIVCLNVTLEIIKLLKENIGKSVHGLVWSENFLNMISKAQSSKEKIHKLDSIKIINLLWKNAQENKKIFIARISKL